jgi:hypothetical protein
MERNNMKDGFLLVTLSAVLAVGVTGCHVEVNKSDDGGGDKVKIATPFGGIAVNQDNTSAAELGLPIYPGSTQDKSHDGNKSAKIDMDFGAMHMRVKVAHYTSPDSQDQIMAFYRKALGKYGDVIECDAGKPVGAIATSGGLNCSPSGQDHSDEEGQGIQLKAGSKHHQHLAVFPDKGSSPTRFTLIALDLPHGFDLEERGTN